MDYGAVGLIIGSIISTISTGIYYGHDTFLTSISVLPNYIYWGILVIFTGNVLFKFITFDQVSKYIFLGVLANVVGRFFLSPILNLIPFYSPGSQNSFAFQMIIFTPIASAWIQNRYKNYFISFGFIILVSLAGILSGSRSGSLLVFFGSSLTVLLGNFIHLLIVGFLGLLSSFLIPTFLESSAVKSAINQLNPRTYELLYETESTLETDRSYLTRLAMIEKGINIFEANPITGIGIGNFMQVTYEIDFDFEGAELIENKIDDLMHLNSHNSYISFLSEGGLLLITPMLLLMFYPLVFFTINYFKIRLEHKGLFIGIFCMCLHSWFIAGMVNVHGWFIISIANAFILNSKHFFIKKVTE